MSGGHALATRPATAPRNPSVRQVTAHVENHPSSFPRAPETDRPQAPPRDDKYQSPGGRPAYSPRNLPPLPPKPDERKDHERAPEAGGKPQDEAGQAGAKDAQGAEPQEGQGEQTAGGPAKDGAAAGKPGKKKSRLVQEEKPEELPEVVEVPQPEVGTVPLEREAPRLSDPAGAFDGPLTLPTRPSARADSKKDGEKDPDIPIYPAVFAEAAAAARRLHDALIADAQAAASAARAGADAAADRRQADLDYSLGKIDEGLTQSLSTVDATCDAAIALVDQRAAEARMLVRRAAGSAHAALIAATVRVLVRKLPADIKRAELERRAASYKVKLIANAGLAVAAMVGLEVAPESVFPVPVFHPMARAVNEAIVTRAPKRAEHRITAYLKEMIAQTQAMTRSFDILPHEFARAFGRVDSWIHNTSKAGPEAVERARAAANKELAKMARQVKGSVKAGRARTKAGLVRQHDAARKQTIAAHKARAKGETVGESRRAEKDVTTLKALGLAQGPATKVIADNLARQVDQGEKPYAKAVVSMSRGFAARVAQTNAGQRSKLNDTAADGRGTGERVSEAAGQRLRDQADTVASQEIQAAREGSDGVHAQANDASSAFAKLAAPVAKSMQGYLPPIGLAFELEIIKLLLALVGVDIAIESYIATGKAIEPAGAKPAEGQGQGKTGEKAAGEPPKMAPKEYMDLTGKVGADPKNDTQIADLVVKAAAEIPKTIATKAAAVWDNISSLGTNTEGVIGALRMITQKQGAAIKFWFYKTYERDIVTYIRMGLPKVLSARSTDELNVSAALNYLEGNQIEGALADLKAAVNYSNEEARVERIQRSLSPAQWAALNKDHAEEIRDVRNDLDGVDQRVFDALQSEGAIFADREARQKRGQDVSTREEDQPGAGVAKANALRLREKLGQDRKKRGDEGADAAADTIENAALDAGNDALSGADQLGLDERRIDALDVTDTAADRNKQSWQQTKRAFDKQTTEGSFGTLRPPPGAKDGWAIVQYASVHRDYKVWERDERGRSRLKIYDEGISSHQTRLMQMIVDHGPDSEEAAAARLMVEMNRDSGKPKPDKVDKAMHMSELDARLGEDKAALKPEEKKYRLEQAKARQEKILRKVAEFQAGSDEKKKAEAAKKSPEVVRQEVIGKLTQTTMVFDPSAAKLVKRSMRGPGDNWDTEQNERKDDAKAAFDYSIVHEADRADTLKRTFGRMDKDEIDRAVAEWNVDAFMRGKPPLYTQLNLFGKGNMWVPAKLHGDERNDVELAAMGVARNDVERALISRMRAQQQIRDAGILGKIAGKITGDWDRLVDSRDRIDELLGLPEGAVDAMGRIKAMQKGNFTADGKFKPNASGGAAELELALHMTHLTAESYKTMTDKLATAVTTGLMVIAAVVTTALTGGAAASIWIPMLVTAGAGLVGIGLTAAIRGERYTPADMQRDLVMTFVQTATAGLGAAAGVAIKGGMPALRAVGSKMLVSEKVLEGLIKTSGTGLSKGAAFVAEIGVGAGTNAINNYAAAYMDPRNRQLGVSGEKAAAAGWSGLLSGGFGSIIMKPAAALGGRVAGGYGQRVLGGAVSNVGSRAVELGYQHYTGERRLESSAEFTEELKTAGATGVVQGVLEEKAGRSTDARRAAAAARTRAPPHEPPPPGTRPPPADEPHRRLPAAGEEPAAARRPEAEPAAPHEGPVSVPRATPDAVTQRLPAPAPEPIVHSVPPEVAPIVKEAQAQLRPLEAPPVVTEPGARPPPIPGPERAASPEATTQRLLRPADEDGPQTQRRPQAEPPPVPGRKTRKLPTVAPEPHPDIPWAPADFLEGAVMLDPHSTSRAEVDKAYWNTVRADPSREVAVYRNPITGEHIVIFGDADKVFVSEKKGEVVGPAPGGRPKELAQKWKDMLPADIGRWELEAHYHPGYGGQHDQAPLARRVPSTGEGGVGDFQVLRYESHAAGNQPRESVIHWTHEGRDGYTKFGHDPNSTEARYWLDVENPATGKREKHGFPDIPAYEKWARDNGIHTNRDANAAAGGHATPGVPGSTRAEEELTLRHGTTREHADSIAAKGINPHRRSGQGDDFGRGFYVTLDEENAQHYANERSKGEPTQGGPATLPPVKVKLGELGVVVDVRTGGEHRLAWDEFLDRTPAAFPPEPLKGFFPTARHYAANRGKFALKESFRGEVFEAFLQEHGLGHADAIRGDLGRDPLTGGISAHAHGEQIAIRSIRAANLLNERLGYPLLPEAPVVPGSVKPTPPPGPPPEPPSGGGPRRMTKAELDALPDPFPEHPSTGPPGPFAHTPEDRARFLAEQQAVDQRAVDAFRAMHPKDGARLQALLDVAPEIVMRAIAGGELTPAQKAAVEARVAEQRARAAAAEGAAPPAGQAVDMRRFHEEALRDALMADRASNKLSPSQVEEHVANLRMLLQTPDERVAAYRAGILSGAIVPDAITKWHQRSLTKSAKQKQAPLAALQEQLVQDFASDLARRGGGIREFVQAVRQLEAWKQAARGLDAEAPAALRRNIDEETLKNYRELKETKGAKPEREALAALDKADRALATEILQRISGDPTQHAELIKAWEDARLAKGKTPAEVKLETDNLEKVLKGGELAKRLQEARAAQAKLGVKTVSLEAMVLADPVLLQLVGTNREQFFERYASIMQRDKNKGKTLTVKEFRKQLDAVMGKGTKSVASEATATFNIAKEMGLDIIKSDSTTRGQTNEAGIDIVAVGSSPEIGPRPEKVPVHIFDDKAVAKAMLGDVTAMTKNLATNLEDVALPGLAEIALREAAGLPVNADHKAALEQMRDAAAEIKKLDPAKYPKTAGSDGTKPYQKVAYADAVRAVLEKHNITMHVTAEYGQVTDLKAWLRHYGFRLWDKKENRPGPAPFPPPPPPPGP